MLDFRKFELLTFDCYGTLINWEQGIFSALRPILHAHGKQLADAEILEIYGDLEVAAEAGSYRSYRDVLGDVVRGFGQKLGFVPSAAEVSALPDSIANWPPFADTVAALSDLKPHYKLVIISNIDDALFALTAPKLGVKFDDVITAQQGGCYKPCLEIFRLAQKQCGVDPSKWLHVGQSIYHDVLPAKSLGFSTVWVNRASPRSGIGAVKPATGKPDLEVPDMRTLADLASNTLQGA
jgi:2-haloacid dehalogenase